MQLRKSIPSILSEKHNRFTFLNLVIMRQTDRHVDRLTDSEDMISNDSLAFVFSSRPIKVSPRSVLGRENVPCVAEVVNRSLKADCTDFTNPGTLAESRWKILVENPGGCWGGGGRGVMFAVGID